ncbi:MAG: cytochrome C, partial [Acidobacteria bacterium]
MQTQAAPPRPAAAPAAAVQASYVGSTRCGDCHPAIYARWSKTRMANVVTDPKVHPEVIIPDFSKADPLLTFTKDDIAFVYGTKWKQRYFKKVGNDYFPLPAQWDVT